MKTTAHYKGHRWTTEELRTLMQLWDTDESSQSIAAKLNCTVFAINKMVLKLRKEGIPLKRRDKGHVAGRRNVNWTQGEVEYLLRRRQERATTDEIASELGRTHLAVAGMIGKLRQEGVPVAMRGNGVRRLWDTSKLKAFAVVSPESNVVELDALKTKSA